MLFRCNKCPYQQKGINGLIWHVPSLTSKEQVCIDCGWVFSKKEDDKKNTKLCPTCQSQYKEQEIYEWMETFFLNWVPFHHIIDLIEDYKEETEIPELKIQWIEIGPEKYYPKSSDGKKVCCPSCYNLPILTKKEFLGLKSIELNPNDLKKKTDVHYQLSSTIHALNFQKIKHK